MCNRDLENLKRWKPNDYLVIERAEILTPQGVEDMRLLARRLQSNFLQLLQPKDENITAKNYMVRILLFLVIDIRRRIRQRNRKFSI